MIKQWAFPWEERASQLQGLGMPVLWLFLFIIRLELNVLFHLKDKSDLSRVAEVWNCHMGKFKDEWFPGQLKLVLTFLYKVFKLECL